MRPAPALLIPRRFRQSPLHIRLHILLFFIVLLSTVGIEGERGGKTLGKVKFSVSEEIFLRANHSTTATWTEFVIILLQNLRALRELRYRRHTTQFS